jgi:hypothetical protein
MLRSLLLALLLLAFVSYCHAGPNSASSPKPAGHAIGGPEEDGYRNELYFGYLHNFGDRGFGITSLNGWNAAYTRNLLGPIDGTVDTASYSGLHGTIRSFMAGPRVAFPFFPRWSHAMAFVHGLAGATIFPGMISYRFSMAFGGGLDIPVKDNFTVRVLQADYYRPSFGPSAGVEHLRLGMGLTYRFGRIAPY